MKEARNKKEDFTAIVDEFSDMIRRICKYHFSKSNEQDDIYQEVLVNIWNSLERFRGNCQMKTWIYRIAVNTALTYRKKSLKHTRIHIHSGDVQLANLVDVDDLSQKLEEEKQLNNLNDEINTLSVIDKMLITLLLEGLSSKEISQIVGITESNVRVKTHRIKSDLRTNLKLRSHE